MQTDNSKSYMIYVSIVIQIIPVQFIPDNFPEVIFGETVYHDDQPAGQYIDAENNNLDRGTETGGILYNFIHFHVILLLKIDIDSNFE